LTRAVIEERIEEIIGASRESGLLVEVDIRAPLGLAELAGYEATYKCSLPEDYRNFVLSMNGFELCFHLMSVTPDRSLVYNFGVLGVPLIFAETQAFRAKILQQIRENEDPQRSLPERSREIVNRSLLVSRYETLILPETSEVFHVDKENMFLDDFLVKIADSFSNYLNDALQTTLENRGDPPAAYH